MTSPGFTDWPETMFSAEEIRPSTAICGFSFAQRTHGTDHCGRTTHVCLHGLHRPGGFDGQAPGIERDALSNYGQGLLRLTFGFVAHDDEARWPCAPFAHSYQATESSFRKLRLVKDLEVEPADVGHFPCALREGLRIDRVRWLVRQNRAPGSLPLLWRFRVRSGSSAGLPNIAMRSIFDG